ncbi:MAG: RNA 2',3'-cyclic phosphodiesterase [Candidatus Omnitrophica bacterium]|nr:RNA 2',3'-cyclic phosphodiesterase [Candidatus Omnitrophota bacterium]
MTIRAFIAVELPEALRQEVGLFQGELRSAGADVKWVDPANLHLTLKFLGPIAEDRVPSLIEALQRACAGLSPFALTLEGIGAFPRTTSPRVVWVGIQEGKEPLAALAGRVEEGCSRLGFPGEERPFSAHLTIGRTRSPQGVARLIKKLQVAEFRGGAPARAERVVLFQSALGPKGPTYTPLAEVPLSGSVPGT